MEGSAKPLSQIKILKIIHLGLVFGPSVFGIVILNMNGVRILELPDLNKPFVYVAFLLGAVGYFLGRLIFVNKLQLAKKQKEKSEKMQVLISGYIIRYSLLEFPALFCFVFYLITENAFYFILGFILILLLIMLRPQKAQIHNWLKVML